jgi:RimJ/RimL family protein N-acetyltransferase
LQWAWANLHVDHIISMIHPENVASIRIAEKLGESFERSEILNGSEVLVYGIGQPQTRDRLSPFMPDIAHDGCLGTRPL